MFLQFTGAHDVNSRWMELKFDQPGWKDRLAKFESVRLFVDVADPNILDSAEARRILERNQRLQLEFVQDVAMPAFAIVAPDGKTVLATYIGVESPSHTGTFARFLDDGWRLWNERRAKSAENDGTRP